MVTVRTLRDAEPGSLLGIHRGCDGEVHKREATWGDGPDKSSAGYANCRCCGDDVDLDQIDPAE